MNHRVETRVFAKIVARGVGVEKASQSDCSIDPLKTPHTVVVRVAAIELAKLEVRVCAEVAAKNVFGGTH